MIRPQYLGLAFGAMLALVGAQSPPPAPLLPPGTMIKAVMATGFDSVNSQVGDQVSITTTEQVKQDKFKLPKGSTFDGHIVKISPAADSDSEASVTLLFDSATTPKGQKYPLHAAIATVTMKAASSSSSRPGGFGGRRRGMGGMGGPPPYEPSSTDTSTPQHLNVRFPQDATTNGSVIVSDHGNFFINPNTKVTLQIMPTAASSAGASQ
jgi:hypothetical protein